jgi:hypothetical protein
MARYYCPGHFLDLGNDALFIVAVSSLVWKVAVRTQTEAKGAQSRVVGVNDQLRSRRIGCRQLNSTSATAGDIVFAKFGSARGQFVSESLKQCLQFAKKAIRLHLTGPSRQAF